MAKIAIDLHMHSILSPCGDEDMTPNNIVNMAVIKGLDYIAVTDHNSALNLPAITAVAKRTGLCVLPGLEITTLEEAHVLAYFNTVEKAMLMGEFVDQYLLDIPNRPDFWGHQYILDEEDEIIGEHQQSLLAPSTLSVNKLYEKTLELEGVLVPAHVDKTSYSLIQSLGFIPDNLGIKTLEISKKNTFSYALQKFPQIKKYQLIHASDAHYLEDIAEREYFINLLDMKRATIIDYLKKKDNFL